MSLSFYLLFFILTTFIIPTLTNYNHGISSILISACINLSCLIITAIVCALHTDKYSTSPFLWTIEAVFTAGIIISGLYLRWKIRYFVFLVATFVLAAGLYIANFVITKKTRSPLSCVWLTIGGLEVLFVKRVFREFLTSTAGVSLGLGIWVGACASEFLLNWEKFLVVGDSLFSFGWVLVGVVLIVYHYILSWKKSFFDLKFEAGTGEVGESDRLVKRGFGSSRVSQAADVG
jgi:hypothetical protein